MQKNLSHEIRASDTFKFIELTLELEKGFEYFILCFAKRRKVYDNLKASLRFPWSTYVQPDALASKYFQKAWLE